MDDGEDELMLNITEVVFVRVLSFTPCRLRDMDRYMPPGRLLICARDKSDI